MGWASLIAMILEVFGPLLSDWLASCTEERLKKAAKELDSPKTFATEAAAVNAMFDQAIDELPRWAVARRAALRRMKAKATVGGKVRTKPLTSAELKEGRKLAGKITPM